MNDYNSIRMLGPINLLYIDEQQWIEQLSRDLEQEDDRFEITTEPSARKGVAHIKDGRIDAVISAYDLPERTGVELLTAVRESHPSLPFIIFAEEGSEEIASDAISAGASDHLIKDRQTSTAVLANRLTTLVEAQRTDQIIEAAQSNWQEVKQRSNDIYYMFSVDWRTLFYINSAYEEVWGASVDRLRENPLSFLEHIHPDDRERAVDSMQQLTNGEATDLEYRIQPPNGELRWVRGVSQPILNANGDVTRVMGAVRDITEIKERERRLQAIFEKSFDAMVLADDDGHYTRKRRCL